MRKFIALLTKEKRLRMNGEHDDSVFLQALCSVYENLGQFCPYLLINLFKERYISSVKS